MRFTPQGKAVCEFSVAINRKLGEGKEDKCFFDLVAWEKTAEAIAQYLRKGSGIFAVCDPKLDEWKTPEGQTRHRMKFHVRSWQFTESKPQSETSATTAPKPQPQSRPTTDNEPSDVPF